MSLTTLPRHLSSMGHPAQGRPWVALFLALLLVVVQGLWSSHATHHVTDGHDTDCPLCLIGAGAGAGLPAALPAVLPRGLASATTTPALPPTISRRGIFRPQSPRAPPRFAEIRR